MYSMDHGHGLMLKSLLRLARVGAYVYHTYGRSTWVLDLVL